MKKCFKCGKKKLLSQFYGHSGTTDKHLGKCKTCTKKDMSERYYDPVARLRIIKYEKARFKRSERKMKVLGYARKMRKKYPGKYRARTKLGNEVRSGRVQKKPCEVCGDPKVEAHHKDYRKPLNVNWLCRKHHMEIEGKAHF